LSSLPPLLSFCLTIIKWSFLAPCEYFNPQDDSADEEASFVMFASWRDLMLLKLAFMHTDSNRSRAQKFVKTSLTSIKGGSSKPCGNKDKITLSHLIFIAFASAHAKRRADQKLFSHKVPPIKSFASLLVSLSLSFFCLFACSATRETFQQK
jgi:hypothetical protein